MRHLPTYDKLSRRGWFWNCTCGDSSPVRYVSRENAVLAFARHELPHAAGREPLHEPTFSTDPLGVMYWDCSCGVGCRARGFTSDQRLSQSHTRHVQTMLLGWYEQQREIAKRQAAEAAEYAARLDRLTPEGRALAEKRALEELL